MFGEAKTGRKKKKGKKAIKTAPREPEEQQCKAKIEDKPNELR